jgi:hypothetical protein
MRLRLALAITLLTTPLFAVSPQFWRVRTVEDFLGGELEGFAVTSNGELTAGPSLKKLASFTDPFVLAQVSAPNGDRFFGTGNDGKVYRLRGTDLKSIYTAPEPEIYSVAYRDGALYVGTSPNGKVYRVDGESGKATVFFDPKQAYIWALTFLDNGDLAIGTGVDGKLFRVNAKGEGKVWFDSPETHIRSLAPRRDGTLLAGGSAKGRIYEVRADGSAHALYDSALNEISAIYVDANNVGWAAAVSNTLPSNAPAKAAAKTTATTTTSTGGEAKKEDSTPSVEVSFSFDDSANTSQAGSGEIYKINPDGFVEIARKFDREMVYAIAGGPNGTILLSTGPQGRIYSMKEGEVSLLAAVPEKQIVSISTEGGQTVVTTTNSGAVYRLENTPTAKAEFRSVAKDVERFSRFGHFHIEGRQVSDGAIDAPAGRYLQWRVTLPKPSADTIIDDVTVAFVNRNVAPVIDSVAVQDPAVVYITGSYPASPQVVEATNPDEYGIFSSLDTPRDKNEQGKKVFRKGYRTISWRGHDDNGDSIRYALSFRRKGSEKWLRLRDNLDESSINFDTSQLPDGVYQLRLVATDGGDNPDGALSDVKEGIEFQIDNTPPVISFTTQGEDVVVHITDKLSTVGKVEYSADAQKWLRLTPADGIADSGDETYRIRRSAVEGKFVIVRATDAFYNVATESVTLP